MTIPHQRSIDIFPKSNPWVSSSEQLKLSKQTIISSQYHMHVGMTASQERLRSRNTTQMHQCGRWRHEAVTFGVHTHHIQTKAKPTEDTVYRIDEGFNTFDLFEMKIKEGLCRQQVEIYYI